MKKFMVLTVELILGMGIGPMTRVPSVQQMGPPITHSKEVVGVWKRESGHGQGHGERSKVTYGLHLGRECHR